jgi:hypothetical protein
MFGLLALQSGGATPGKPINDDDKPHEDLNRLGTFIAKALAQAPGEYDPDYFMPLENPLAHLGDARRQFCVKRLSASQRYAVELAMAEIDAARKIAKVRARIARKKARERAELEGANTHTLKNLSQFVKEETEARRRGEAQYEASVGIKPPPTPPKPAASPLRAIRHPLPLHPSQMPSASTWAGRNARAQPAKSPSRTPSTAPAAPSESLAAPPAADLLYNSWWQPISDWIGLSNPVISVMQEISSEKECHNASAVSFSQPATPASVSAKRVTKAVPSGSPFHATAYSTPRKQTPQAMQDPPAEGAGYFETLRAEAQAAIDGAIEEGHRATRRLFSDKKEPQEEVVSDKLKDRFFSPRGSPSPRLLGCKTTPRSIGPPAQSKRLPQMAPPISFRGAYAPSGSCPSGSGPSGSGPSGSRSARVVVRV